MQRRTTIRVLQLNCNRGRGPHDMLTGIARRRKADVLMVSEPNKRLCENSLYHSDARRDAAVRITSSDLTATGKGQVDGVAWCVVNGITIASVYISPSISIEEFCESLDRIGVALRTSPADRWIVAGDFNAKNRTWSSRRTDARGTVLLDWAASLDLCCLNRGDAPTFERAGTTSHIDVTFASSNISHVCKEWKVLEHTTLSDHNCIEFTIDTGKPRSSDSKTFRGWRYPRDRKEAIRAAIGLHLQDLRCPTVDRVTEALQDACNDCLPRKGARGSGKEYWRSSEIDELHRESDMARRKLQRARKSTRGNPGRPLVDSAEAARTKLKEAIEKSKADAWDALRNDLNSNPWGTGYAVAMGKLAPPPKPLDRPTVDKVVKHLFPQHPKPTYRRIVTPRIDLFTHAELRAAARRLKPGKSGGPDGIPPEVVKEAVDVAPTMLLEVMNGCLSRGIFPRRWKRGRLVLIPKQGKPEGAPNAYRPLCLLDTLGKLLEQLILARLRGQLQERDAISTRQHGFQPGRSTISACEEVQDHIKDWSGRIPLVLLLDVKNAFNSAPWEGILRKLDELKISLDLKRLIQAYLRNRRLIVESTGGTHEVKVTSGVPQGSILGPTLWNILYNGVLEKRLPQDCEATGYADDLAIKVEARTVESLQIRTEDAYERVARWLRCNNIALEPTKTEALMVCGRRHIPTLALNLEGTLVRTKRTVKYLGVWLNRSSNYADHAREQAVRANQKTNMLTGLLANKGGPLPSRRKVLCGAITSILLYAAPIWAGKMLPTHIAPMEAAQRSLALRICCAYRTVSKEAALVLAGTPPIRLQAGKARKIQRGVPREVAEQEMLTEWQTEWDSSPNGAWTRRLIPQLRPWLNRKEGEVDYHLTQVLTGHGGFWSYLHRFNRRPTGECEDCGVEDTPEHCLFDCRRWDTHRDACERTTGRLAPDSLTATMLSSGESWAAVATMAKKILEEKD